MTGIVASPAKPAVVILSEAAASLGRRIAAELDGELHGAASRVTDADIRFSSAKDHVQALFSAGRPIVAVMASGALIRLLAPLLADKHAEPPVLAIAEDGSSVVPLLGVAFCLLLMSGLPLDTWLRLIGWLVIGLAIYFLYGRHHSALRARTARMSC